MDTVRGLLKNWGKKVQLSKFIVLLFVKLFIHSAQTIWLQVVENTKVNNIIYINRQFQRNIRGALRNARSENTGSRHCTFKNQEKEP